MTWKYRSRLRALNNTEELETEISDFDKAVTIISKIRKRKRPIYQETKLEKWNYKGVEVAICTWPLVPPFLELESDSERKIRSAIKSSR